jgi:cAMP-dependent protein kinase regulator
MLTKDLQQGIGFGEIALLYNDKRSATVIAKGDCMTYTLDGVLFKTMIVRSSIKDRALKAGFLDSIALFDSLDKFQKLKLVDGL